MQWGNDDDRFFGMVISDEFLTPAERADLFELWGKAVAGEGEYDPAAYLTEKGHTLLGIGSELSGGIRNVYMTNCTTPGNVLRLYYVKTNHRRGGFVENIWLKGAKVRACKEVVALATDVVYQWKDFPDYETKMTRIEGLHVEDVEVDSCETVITLIGDKRLPARGVTIKNLKVGKYSKKFCEVENVENIEL